MSFITLYVGLSVAYLSGRESSDAQQFGVYSQDDVDALRAIAEEPGIVDLFLTYPLICMHVVFPCRSTRVIMYKHSQYSH